jgi:hypothetical protein
VAALGSNDNEPDHGKRLDESLARQGRKGAHAMIAKR